MLRNLEGCVCVPPPPPPSCLVQVYRDITAVLKKMDTSEDQFSSLQKEVHYQSGVIKKLQQQNSSLQQQLETVQVEASVLWTRPSLEDSHGSLSGTSRVSLPPPDPCAAASVAVREPSVPPPHGSEPLSARLPAMPPRDMDTEDMDSLSELRGDMSVIAQEGSVGMDSPPGTADTSIAIMREDAFPGDVGGVAGEGGPGRTYAPVLLSSLDPSFPPPSAGVDGASVLALPPPRTEHISSQRFPTEHTLMAAPQTSSSPSLPGAAASAEAPVALAQTPTPAPAPPPAEVRADQSAETLSSQPTEAPLPPEDPAAGTQPGSPPPTPRPRSIPTQQSQELSVSMSPPDNTKRADPVPPALAPTALWQQHHVEHLFHEQQQLLLQQWHLQQQQYSQQLEELRKELHKQVSEEIAESRASLSGELLVDLIRRAEMRFGDRIRAIESSQVQIGTLTEAVMVLSQEHGALTESNRRIEEDQRAYQNTYLAGIEQIASVVERCFQKVEEFSSESTALGAENIRAIEEDLQGLRVSVQVIMDGASALTSM